ncbi:MAG TPA: type II secretion system protein [Candidatus Saccharimonadales bacterium]|nr:type II secretion system protein [Candidatus Saccharimonadales bacterium]
MSKNKGFTIIELLLVVSLIAILSGVTLTVLNVSQLQKRPRDAQRVSDLGRMQTALELFFADNRVYPTAASWATASGALAALKPSYISDIPAPPTTPAATGSDPCTAGNSGYFYISDATGNKYVLATIMELSASATSSTCTGLSNWGGLSLCGSPVANCYGAQNP